MHYNDTFKSAYLSIINESTEDENKQFTFVCKTCNTGFTDQDGVKVGDECPVKDCEGKVQEFKLDDYSGDGVDLPKTFNVDENQAAENDTEIPATEDDCDFLNEDDLQNDGPDDEFNADNCDLQNDGPDDEFDDSNNENADFQEEDPTVRPADGETTGQGEGDDNDEIDDDLQDEDADDEAAKEDQDKPVEDETQETDETPEEVTKLVSFTTTDPAIIEVLEKIQSGELKLAAVPVDFEFAEDDKNENPFITADTLENFDIENVEDNEGEETADEQTDETDADTQEPSEDQPETTPAITKETACCNVKIGVKGSKYGPY